ncbi:hypothetical protein V7O67_12790 [Methanolobus sp. ZRKC4]|uniref:hypothetical protein n=1 Tax=Methanolobus sp. ZRKC4 TaxID=3125787 RepID=UPI00324AD4EA
MVGMKYNRYLIAGITLVTILLLFIFSGAVTETETELFKTNGFDAAEHGYSMLLLGIGLPLLLATIFIFTRMRKGEPLQKQK